MNEPGLRRTLPEQFSGSGHTFGTQRHQSVTNPILSKRVCFYKSGDPQFNGLRMVINNRTFKTFEALLDSLSKKVPLPFGVRNITTPRGVHAVSSLDELEDGKSYICSDHRKVKPINLAMARKKLPPWYHARPVSSRRRTIQKARLYPGHKLHNPDSVVMRTPKKILVFRNGDPEFKCGVVLQKKTTPTFDSILRYISDLMQFNVAKLHTPEGRRVDGLPALIMCSGTVVAAGREKFKPANYNSQKPFEPSRMRTNRRSVRRLKALSHKKRSYAKPRILSPSSERYIVSQIHNTIAESACSMPTNSIEMESIHVLDSVAESEAENFDGAGVEGQDCLLPTDDDIEKSFRVNQDGSMTVEMKVRLTIKEEETLHWTTTLSRSSVSDQLTGDSFLAPGPEQEISLPESDHMDLRTPAATTNYINKNKDICNEDPISISNGVYNQSSLMEDNKTHEDLVSPFKTSSPGPKPSRTKQASVESITSLTAEGFKEDIVGSYFKEHLDNGNLTEQFCTLKHINSRPIPKPRRVGSVEANNHNISTYKSAEMTEIFQMDSDGEEITETVMHIYEQQTCQDNFLANIFEQGLSTSAVKYCRPATSDTCHQSTNGDFQPQPCRPSTASESVSLWRSESISLKSNLTFQSQNSAPTYTQSLSQELIKSQNKDKVKDVKKERRVSPKHKVTIKRLKSPGNTAKEGQGKKNKPFTNARLITKIYGNKTKSKKDMSEQKKRTNAIEAGTTKGPYQTDEFKTEAAFSETRETFTEQTSLNQKKQRRNSIMPLPVMSNTGTNGYVEDWLQKSQSKPPLCLEEETESHIKLENLENDPCLMSVAEKVKCLKEKPKASHNSAAPLPELTRNGSVRQKVKCFENKTADTHHPDTNSTNNSWPKDLSTDIIHTSGSSIVHFEARSNLLLTDLPPPPAQSLLEFSSLHAIDGSAANSPLYRLSSVSDIHPLSTSPTSDRAISPTDHTMEMVSSIQTDNPSELREAPLQRAPSIKRAPLVSNLSLERKMSLKKASLDEYTIPKESTPLHIQTVADNSLGESIEPIAERLISKSIFDLKSNPSYYSSASPVSLTSDHRTSSTSVLSNEAPKTIKQSNEKVSPKPKKVNLIGSPSPKRKHQTKKTFSEVMKKSQKLHSINDFPATKNISPNTERKKSATPSASPASEKRQIQSSKSKLLKKTSPYSQSLDLASPRVKHKIKKSLHRNLSTDSQVTSKTPNKMSSQTRTEQTQLSQVNKSRPEEATKNDLTKGDHEKNTKVISQSFTIIQRGLEKLCFSIKTIHQINQHKQNTSKGDRIPEFSSYVSSTFGSPPKALLAFLSVMTLKEITPKPYVERFDANDVNCSEALEMMDSLREIASIDEPQTLRMSLFHLRHSASQSLLQSWKRFQECCEKNKSYSSLPKTKEMHICGTKPEQLEDVIDQLMNSLRMPEILRNELASFSLTVESTCENYEDVTPINNIMLTDNVNQKSSVYKLNMPDNQEADTYELATAENQKSQTEEKQDSDWYVELNVGKSTSKVRPDSESESNSASDTERMQLVYSSGMDVHSTVDDSVTDVDEISLSEEDLQNQVKELNIIVEEHLSDEEQETGVGKQQTGVDIKIHFENDSGNDDSCCEVNSTKNEIMLIDEELCSGENESSSEKQTGIMSGYVRESCIQTLLSEDERIENIAKKLCDDVISQSVSEHVTCSEKKIANGLRRDITSSLQEVSPLSDRNEPSTESPMSQLSPGTRSAPQSSLSFSYDSTNVITKQPVGHRIKSIREMFLAKSVSDNQPKTTLGSSTSDTTELRANTSVSGGYQSQTSSEISGGEDDSSRKSITKGFVMRTIERLYGQKESPSKLDKSDRPLSAQKQKKKDQTSIFSHFHATRSKTVSELSYFNSSTAVDAISEATRCIAFNAQVSPGDSVLVDNGKMFLQESPILKKSVSDPVAIHQNVTIATQEEQQPCKDTEEKTPYLLFKTDSEDEQKLLSRKCTYFSLPHANDSDIVQEEESAGNVDIKSDISCEVKEIPEDTKLRPEKNGKLPGGVTDFKMMDNKVHPLAEVPPAEEAVVVQPVRGQGVMSRRVQEPDVLDILYNFCGEHCPIL